MTPEHILNVVAMACAFLGAWMIQVQMRAHQCPKHQKSAGVLAWMMAVLLWVVAIGLFFKLI